VDDNKKELNEIVQNAEELVLESIALTPGWCRFWVYLVPLNVVGFLVMELRCAKIDTGSW
jgi:hypothetical protein